MKEEILKLRGEGKSYREIRKILKCSSGTIAYHCGQGQKLKSVSRQNKRRKSNILEIKVERFRGRDISEKVRSFQRRERSKLVPRREYNFKAKDLLDKIGSNSICYLSGRTIDLQDGKSYHLDHIKPTSQGGNNSLENAGILHATINKMKHDLTVEEFISTCKEVLEYQGYTITKKED